MSICISLHLWKSFLTNIREKQADKITQKHHLEYQVTKTSNDENSLGVLAA